MKFKLIEAAESKICCICKKPFDGYGNNAEPVCSGSCCDECNMNEVIPARMKMLDNSSSKDINEALEDYKLTYYLSTATAERRPETIEDVENDWKEEVFAADSDYDALLYALELIDSDYDDTDFSTAEEIVKYFEEKDLGDGSAFVVKLEGPNGVIYDMGQTKEDFIEQVKENDEMLGYYRDVLGIDESLNEASERFILIGFNHFDPENLIVIHGSKAELESINDDRVEYSEIIPATDKLIWIENNDEYLQVSPTDFNSIDEFRNAIVGEMQRNIDAGNNEFEILGLTSFYIDEDSEGLSAQELADQFMIWIDDSYVDGDSNSAIHLVKGNELDNRFISYISVEEFMTSDDVDDEVVDESLNENSVSSKIPEAIDQFLQDIAQMYQTISYKDIMDHDYTAEDLQKLARLRGKFRREITYADGGDDDAAAVCEEIANDVAEILKNVHESMNEGRNDPYFTPYGYRAAAKVLNRTAPQYYWHLKEIEMERGDGIKLANYALKKGLPVMIDPNDDPDYPTFYLEDGSSIYHWNDYFYPYETSDYNKENLIPYTKGMFDILNTEKDDNKMNEDMGIRAKLKALYPELNFGDKVEEAINEAVDLNKTLSQFSNGDEYYDYFKKVIRKVAKENKIDSKIAISDKALRITSIEDDYVQYFRKDLIVNALDNIMHESGYSDYTPFDIFWEIIDEVPAEEMGMHHAFEKDDYNGFKHDMNIKYGFTTTDNQLVEKELNEAVDPDHFADLQAYAEEYEGDELISYDSEYSDYISDLYNTATDKLESEFKDLFIEPSIEGTAGSVFAWYEKDGQKYEADWNFEAECEFLDEIILSSTSEEEYINKIMEYLRNKLNADYEDEEDWDDEDDLDDDTDFDIEEDADIRRMNTLYKGSEFDAHDDAVLEESSDCEDDECWENDLIFDDYDDGM